MLPLYESKMVAPYDHRDADIVKGQSEGARKFQPRSISDKEHAVPSREPLPNFWVHESAMPKRLPGWLTGFANITSPTNERTVKATAIPRTAVGDMMPLWFGSRPDLLLAVFNSFAFDFIARQKVAGLRISPTRI